MTSPFRHGNDLSALGRQMHEFIAEAFPICRSITGDGFRSTLAMIGEQIPVEIHEVPSGTTAFDWTVPPEWNVRDAYVANPSGERVIDFRENNLHLMSYSIPVRGKMSLDDLRPHLHDLPEQPDLIPYRTSYYAPDWGFCLTANQRDLLGEGPFDVLIDTSLEDGSLTYGECFLPGSIEEEVLITSHACHPSMANDNLSGVALVTTLAGLLSRAEHRFSYRFLFIPGAIGSITWLSRNAGAVARIRHGLVAACVGDRGVLNYKRSRRGDAAIDRAAAHVVSERGGQVRDFSPYGYDERQFNTPGFDLPVGCLSRTPHGEFLEYHTSGDDLTFVTPESLADSLSAYLDVLEVLEGDGRYLNLSPKGEPQLGKRGLYPSIGGKEAAAEVMATLWVLNQSDGEHSLLDIADRAHLPFSLVRETADRLEEAKLLAPAPRQA